MSVGPVLSRDAYLLPAFANELEQDVRLRVHRELETLHEYSKADQSHAIRTIERKATPRTLLSLIKALKKQIRDGRPGGCLNA